MFWGQVSRVGIFRKTIPASFALHPHYGFIEE